MMQVQWLAQGQAHSKHSTYRGSWVTINGWFTKSYLYNACSYLASLFQFGPFLSGNQIQPSGKTNFAITHTWETNNSGYFTHWQSRPHFHFSQYTGTPSPEPLPQSSSPSSRVPWLWLLVGKHPQSITRCDSTSAYYWPNFLLLPQSCGIHSTSPTGSPLRVPEPPK